MIMSRSEVGRLRLDERIRAITQVRDRLASAQPEMPCGYIGILVVHLK